MRQNVCSMCSGSGTSVNYAKKVDPPVNNYGTILGDAPKDGDCQKGSRGQSGAAFPCIGMCVSSSPPRGPSTHIPQSPPAAAPHYTCCSCPPPPPTRIWLIKSSPAPQKSFCLPMGGSSSGEASSSAGFVPIIVCVPPQPEPEPPKPPKKEEELKPIGYISRNKDVDFIGGKLIGGCLCGRKNGLSGDCPRISCRNNPGCFMNPPRCWPQFKLPDPPPPPPPDQKMICLPFQVVFCDPPPSGGPKDSKPR